MSTRWDPFRDMLSIQDRMNRLFQETMARSRGQETIEGGAWSPAVDILENGERILLRADLPGLEQADIELRVDDGTLVLRGNRQAPQDNKPEEMHRAERPFGPFARTFGLPGNVDQTAIRASFKNGVLEVVLPKKREAQAKTIRVEVK